MIIELKSTGIDKRITGNFNGKENISKLIIRFLIVISFCVFIQELSGQEKKVIFLSGTDKDHTVEWDFFCTEGRKSGYWTTIPVPSNWELQGFGNFNYGRECRKETPHYHKEHGLYKFSFHADSSWAGMVVNLVFEGSMTDTKVNLNGRLAGSVHQGAFYQFKYNISDKLNYGGDNLLEVDVAKWSGNESVNKAERYCDFWIFGGIYRPVYLEVVPKEHIERLAINALANGDIDVDVFIQNILKVDQVQAQVLTLDNEKVGEPFLKNISEGETEIHLSSSLKNVRAWNPESPNLYKIQVSLLGQGELIYSEEEKFGFRTVEFREKDGIYVNGVKIKFKGVNRHSAWPTSGRTTGKALSISDVKLMKEMNMNAVRMSHYPPDAHFLDACDSLGLFVLNELTGWHDEYDTQVGTKLVHEMLYRDLNHPSIVIWANGNERGWNLDLDHLFDEIDPQNRPLIHPDALFRGINTKHYLVYRHITDPKFYGENVTFPTEFLHGNYDGGHGAALSDYWDVMWKAPLCAGGFLWNFADEGVVRSDKNNIIDTDNFHAPDGILGPFREKEASFYTIKEVWSPVVIKEPGCIDEMFNGEFDVENRFFYTNLNQCTFNYSLVKLPLPYKKRQKQLAQGVIASPDIEPGSRGVIRMDIPKNLKEANVLYLTVKDPSGAEIFTWSFNIKSPSSIADKIVEKRGKRKIEWIQSEGKIDVSAGGLQLQFDNETGLLNKVRNKKGPISFNNGPVLINGKNRFRKFQINRQGNNLIINSFYDGDFKKVSWKIYPSGWVQLDVSYLPPKDTMDYLGISFNYPESKIRGMRWMGEGPYRVWKNREKGNRFNVWQKYYNNTITGEGKIIYPEFKGYHANMSWVTVETTEQAFTIVCPTQDIYLQMLKPEKPGGLLDKKYYVIPPFPKGDISFMHGIPPIGSKNKPPKSLGPASQSYLFTEQNVSMKKITLFFDFRGI